MEPISSLLRSPLLALTGPALIVILVALFWMRSGSIYALLERIWRLITGKGEVSDKNLIEFIQDTRDLEKFRFIYGLKVETKDELYKLLEWLRKNSISIGSAQRASQWIEVKSTGVISSPPKNYLFIKTITAVFCIVLATIFVEIATYESALFQMKKSKVWFLANDKVVKGVTSNWIFEKSQCIANINDIQSSSGFSESEAATICDALKQDSLKQLVSDTVKLQKIFGVAFSVGVFVWMLVIFFQMTSAKAAIDINMTLTQTNTTADNNEMLVSTTPRETFYKKAHFRKGGRW